MKRWFVTPNLVVDYPEEIEEKLNELEGSGHTIFTLITHAKDQATGTWWVTIVSYKEENEGVVYPSIPSP